MAIAVRIARAHTGRDVIAFCGYHGWADWYLANNLTGSDGLAGHLLRGLEPAGVPKGLKGTVEPFRYNHIEELEEIIKKHGKLAAIVMEPIHGEEPEPGFFKKVQALAKKAEAVLVMDEITVGFRLTESGAHALFGITPDMAIFAKGMSNGYPMSAIIGRKEVMQAAQDTFISSTYWTEAIGPTAALATIRKIKKLHVPKKLAATGSLVRQAWQRAAQKHGVPIRVSGVAPLLFFAFEGVHSQVLKTLFVQEMLQQNILASNLFYPSLAHTKEHVSRYARALDKTFAVLREALDSGTPERFLKGPVAHTGFQRLN